MTTEQESTNLISERISPIQSVAVEFKGIGTLRRRLLTTILPAVLLPLVIASAIGYTITERRAKTQALSKLEENTLLTSATVTAFIRDSFKIPDLVASNPVIMEAMRIGSQEAQTQGLPQQSIEAVEQKFATTKLIKANTNLNNYLQQIVKSSDIVEIFFTERNGFNVAFSNPTSDFVQRDEGWWQTSKQNGRAIDEPEFDESANAVVFALSEAVIDPETKEFLGVIKAGIPVKVLDSTLNAYLSAGLNQSQIVQVVDSQAGSIMSNITPQGSDSEIQETIGGAPILQVAKTIVDSIGNGRGLDEIEQLIQQKANFANISLQQKEVFSEVSTFAQLTYRDKIYDFATIPNTDLVVIASVDAAEIGAAGRRLLTAFALTAIVLGTISLGLIIALAQQLSRPLTDLSEKTQQVASGNLDVKASLEGTLETRTLADNFNKLVDRVKELLQQQKSITEQQRQEKEQLEAAIYTLIDEVSNATEGDLTVRANLDSMELSTVADLFNAIIDNLQEIAVETKQSTSQVGSSLKENEDAIRLLAEQAIAEARETRDTLMSVEQMSRSIQAVAKNASQAEKIADDTYSTVLSSTNNMNLTVDSILELRTTVGETAKKMKRLGESSQKISQAVSFIAEIALRTNVLAINASVEAGRAGEYGQGFTIVAEQVGALAEQSAAATKEIANIVAVIQAETQEVNQAMESGTSQVVETTRLVESTKQSLGQVLEKSQEINQLMGSISQTTVSQANTSQNVTDLMQKIAYLSETASISSREVAQSMVETAKVAAKLESTVAQFKVAE
ncbi:MAG: methyl-accepting chemotaxis protein [Xenococcaceae cyanobacterium MO_188.B32]|nr:methyl-accepting chemotaxis protein [Xenococcaceae cyanobacterium MO_188.B32]